MTNPNRDRITDTWDEEDGDNAWFLPEDMGDQ